MVVSLGAPAAALDPVLEYDADRWQVQVEEETIYLAGDVNIMYQNASLSADEAILDASARIAEATGNVILWIDGQRIFGHYAFFNFETQEGFLEGAELDGEGYFAKGARVQLVTRPAEDGREAKKYIEVYGGSATTCDLIVPHYHGQAGKIRFIPEERVTATNMVLKFGNMPVAYVPYFRRSLRERWHAYILSGGYSSRKGAIVYNKYHLHFNRQFLETAYADWMSSLGYGAGWKHRFENPQFMWPGRGQLFGYYFEQTDDDDEEDRRGLGGKGGRWHLQGELEQQITPDLRLTGRFLNVSDEDYTDDFEEELVDRGVDREDLFNGRNPFVNLAWTQPDFNLRALYKERMDDFVDFRLADEERKPQLRWDVRRLSLLDSPLYVNYHLDYSRLREERLSGVEGDSTEIIEETDRLDTDVEFSAPFSLTDWLRVNPFVGYEFTHYQDPRHEVDIDTPTFMLDQEAVYDDVSRHIFRYGVDLNTRRVLNLGAIGDRFTDSRLLFEPTLSLIDFYPTDGIREVDVETDPASFTAPDFIAIDEVDTITDYARVVRLRLDTRWQGKTQPGSFTLIRHSLQVGRDIRNDVYEDIASELYVNPLPRWSLHNFTRYDLEDDLLRSSITGTSYQVFDRLAVRGGYAHYEALGAEDDDNIYWGLTYRISPKWLAEYQHDYDVEDDAHRSIRVSLTRDMHDWALVIGIRHRNRVDHPDDTEVRFSVNFKPFPTREAVPVLAEDYVDYVEGTGYPTP